MTQRVRMCWRPAATVALFVFLCSGTARAQERLPLSEVLPQLLGNTIKRTSESFGPTFAERALTIGRGRVSVGLGYQHATYDTFEGLNLRQRDLTFYVPHIDCCSRGGGTASQPDESLLTPAFEGDLVKAALALDLVTDASVFVVNYGVHDRLDVGVAVPFVHVSMDASVLATIERLSTKAEPEVHAFGGLDADRRIFRASSSASGLGDIVVRTKYVLLPAESGGVAAAVDLRLPTGDETNLLGTGGVQARVYGIGSITRGPISPHVNAGYTFSTRGALPDTRLRDEINVAMGFDLALTPRATVAVDFLGRTLLDAGRLREADKLFSYAPGGTGSGGGRGDDRGYRARRGFMISPIRGDRRRCEGGRLAVGCGFDLKPESCELVSQRLEIVIAVGRVERHRATSHANQFGVYTGRELREPHNLGAADSRHDVADRSAERRLARNDFVEDTPQPEHVAAPIDRAAGELFGRHVAQGAQDVARLRLVSFDHARDAKVEDLESAIGAADQILRLDIQVHDAGSVCERQTDTRILDQSEHFGLVERRLPIDERSQGLAGDVLHRDERAAAMFAHIMTMFSWCSRPAARASRVNRSRAAVSNAAASTFTATRRSIRGSRAR